MIFNPINVSSSFFDLRVGRVLVFAAALLMLSHTSANVAAQGASERGSGSVQPRPLTAEDNRYRIGPGDVLNVVVRKAPELSGSVRVDQRGMIRLPLIDNEVQAACHTESELASQITTLYLDYKRAPSVDVFVSEFQSRPVAVIGAVNAPGQFRLQRQVRLLELLSFAGGPANKAGRLINIIHAGGPNLCEAAPVAGDNSSTLQQLAGYKLEDTLKGKEDANPHVQPGDIVNIPEADQVFIIGRVQSPQALPLREKRITISRAVAICGGASRDANIGRIHIIRQEGDGDRKQDIYVDLKAVLKQKAEDVVLVANDIVEVPTSTGKSILQTLQGAIAPAITQLPVRVIP